jgi:crotonobetainyl-CoA:carnitine CoA-transferase CaiB-like acyl-CoA transferase
VAPLPLEGVRILALEQYAAGPYGTVHLADLGAEIIKLEDPPTGGDISRYVRMPAVGDCAGGAHIAEPPGEDTLFYETFNRNKRSLGLDLRRPEGRAVFEDLVRVSDAVYFNMRGDVPEKLRLRYADLAHLNPRIVCCSLSAYGQTGDYRAEPGYDYMLQAMCGWMSLTGEPGAPPAKSGLSVVDFAGGLAAGYSLVAALLSAARTGVGADCDVSLYDVAMSFLSYPGTWHLSGGHEPERMSRSAHPSLVPFQAFEASDGWVVLGCAKEKFFARMCAALDVPEVAEDPRYATFADRYANKAALIAELDRAVAKLEVAEILGRMRAAGVPAGPVLSVPDALAHPLAAQRGVVVTTEHPVLGTVRAPGSPVRVGPARPEHVRAPRRNEHADYVLRDLLGYDDARVAEVLGSGAVGP